MRRLARRCSTQAITDRYRRWDTRIAPQPRGAAISRSIGSNSGWSTVSTPPTASSEMTPFMVATQAPTIRRADGGPCCAVSIRRRNSPSSMASSSTRAAACKYCSFAARSTFGSSRPAADVDHDARSAPATATTAPAIRAGTASETRSAALPSARSEPSTELTTSRPSAAVIPWPASATPTVSSAGRSVRQASRRVPATMRGIARTADSRLVSRKSHSWSVQPRS